MSDSSRPSLEDDDHSFWADDPEPVAEPTHAGLLHSRVFVLGVVTIAGTVLGLAGLTWAGSDTAELSAAQIAAAKAAPAGACTFTVADKSSKLEAVRARSLTMIAAVGHQVAAPDVQIARAIDVAMGEQGTGSTKVMDALALLARDDAAPPSRQGLAELNALETPGALTCRYTPVKLPVEKKNDAGLTKRADKVRLAVVDAFGKLPTSGYTKPAKADSEKTAKSSKSSKSKSTSAKPAPAATGPAADKADGRVVDVLVAPKADPNADPKVAEAAARTQGWLLAHWLVARGDVFKLDSVVFGDHTWSAASAAGWQAASPAAVALDLDRVHITVQRGG